MHRCKVVAGVFVALCVTLGAMAPADARARNCALPDDTSDGLPDYAGTGDRQIRPNVPSRLLRTGCDWPDTIRAIAIVGDEVRLHRGGEIVRRIDLGAGPVRLETLTASIDDPDWIREASPGIFEASAAIMAREGVTLRIEGPAVKELRLVDRPFVHLGGHGATALIRDTVVTSWRGDRGGPATDFSFSRPYVLFEASSRLDTERAVFRWLGSDTSRAYGVSWFSGSRGSAIDSVFERGYFGAYTHEAIDLVFRGNEFADNELYGWDPHDDSHGLLAENNVAHGNGSHGFIVSNRVHDSIIRNNHSWGNGGNGIVIDRESSNILVENNLVEDNADGIVVNNAGHSIVRHNTIRNNRTGIRIKGPSRGMRLEANTIEGGERGIQAYAGAAGVTVVDNTIRGPRTQAILVDAPHTLILANQIRDSGVGIEIRSGSNTVRFVDIDRVDHGIKVKTDERTELSGIAIRARAEGIRVPRAHHTTVAGLRISAPVAVVGLTLPAAAVTPY